MQRELTQSALARETGLSQSFLVQLEKGNRFPSPESIEKICRALHCHPYELFLEKPLLSGGGGGEGQEYHGMAMRLQERCAEAIQEVLEEYSRGRGSGPHTNIDTDGTSEGPNEGPNETGEAEL